MATIDPSRTLATLVNERPAVARRFEALELDYCCGGERTLAEASAEAGLDLAEVIAELEETRAPGPEPWATMGPGELVDHLEEVHHTYLEAELPRISALAAKVRGVHGERHPELAEVSSTFEALRADLEPHLLKEERILFPAVRAMDEAGGPVRLPFGTVQHPISVMVAEHEQVGELLAELRRLTHGYTVPDDGCASYAALFNALAELEADTHLHIHKENNLLFPAVVALEQSTPTR